MARGRFITLIAVICAGLAAGTVLAVQANASGGGSSPSAPKPGAAPAVVRPTVLATNAHCGQTVTASLTLNGDLFCSGDGLIVTGTSVVLNLNGHEVHGPNNGTSIGIRLTGKTDTVENGIVDFFAIGVYVPGTGDTVSAVRASRNRTGIIDGGPTTKLTNNIAWANTDNGIEADFGASSATYSGDHELNNGGDGVVLVVNATKMTITGNIAEGNAGYGIDDAGTYDTLTKNIANFNGKDGITVYSPTAKDGGGNTAKGNDYVSGNVPVQCFGVVCV